MKDQSQTLQNTGAATTVHLLRCLAGDQTYCLNMALVRGIRRVEEVQAPSPEHGTSHWLVHEGQEVAVVSLAARLKLPSVPGAQGKVVLCQTSSRLLGLLVDRLDGRLDVTPEQLFPVPRLARNPADPLVESVVQHNGSLLLVLAPTGLQPQAWAVRSTPRRPPRPDVLPVLTRMSAASGASGAVLCFTMLEQPPGVWPVSFGLSLSQVAHMQQSPLLYPVPGAPPHVLGLTSWQGYPLAVLDLSRCLGGMTSVLAQDSRLLIARATSMQAFVSFLVRPQVRVRSLPLSHRPSDRPLSLQTSLLRGRFDLDQETLVIPDLDRLFILQEEQGC